MRNFIILCIFVNSAFSWCSEPLEPSCLNFGFNDSNFNWCKMEVEDFIDDMQDYSKCLLEENQEKINEVIEKFNCRANGKSYCY